MIRHIHFDRFHGSHWPSQAELKPYFFAPPQGRGWFYEGGNDSAGLDLLGAEGTGHLPKYGGRLDISLSLYGSPEHGVTMRYEKHVLDTHLCFYSKGNLSRLLEFTWSLHDDPLSIGLFIPSEKAWEAVKEFMDTEGQLPTSIEWIADADLPPMPDEIAQYR